MNGTCWEYEVYWPVNKRKQKELLGSKLLVFAPCTGCEHGTQRYSPECELSNITLGHRACRSRENGGSEGDDLSGNLRCYKGNLLG
jgi:hypothetical protein